MEKWKNWALVALGAGFIAFQIYLIWYSMGVISQRILHICFAVEIAHMSKPLSLRNRIGKILDAVLILVPVAIAIYVLVNQEHIETRLQYVDAMTWVEVVLGTMLIVAVIEAARRALGTGLTIVVLAFIAYYFLGPIMPGLLAHTRVSFSDFVESNFIASTGMFGVPVGVSVQDVFYFIMFGSFLTMSGGGRFLIDLAIRVAGRSQGGPAKVAVVASALFGTISGSAVANVVGTGVMTIPLMKRVGYPPKTAGAVEAIASTGGQLMPPVMGAAAFVLAEMTRTPYLMVCKAAIMPAIAYYLSLFAFVHFKAGAIGIRILSKEDLAEFGTSILRRLHLLIPIGVLIYSIAAQSSLMTAAFRASVAAVLVGFLRRETRPTLSQIMEGIADVGKQASTVAIPCAAAGIIIGSLTLTGAGLKFTDLLLGITGGMLIPTVLLTMLACIILGMGMPTTAAYIMAAVLMGPALVKLGFPLLSAHLFIFYFAIISMVTPPVAVAAYAGAAIAGADMWETGWEAFWMAIPGFIIPFIFLSSPALLLEHSSLSEIIRTCATTFIGVVALAGSMVGWFRTRLKLWERIALLLSGVLMLIPELYTDIIGLVLFGVIYIGQRMKGSRVTPNSDNL
jgi:TRAP transporter 4TM/12TM fusion protein